MSKELERMRQRFFNEPKFHSLAQTIFAAVESGDYTFEDFCDALKIAQLLDEEHTYRRLKEPGNLKEVEDV